MKTDNVESNEATVEISVKVTTASHAIAALTVLGKLMDALLDIIYQSEEKDKVLPLLTTVMYNLVPYLRTHHQQTPTAEGRVRTAG